MAATPHTHLPPLPMPFCLPPASTFSAADFDAWSRAHSRISEALEALAQCRISYANFLAGAPSEKAAFEAYCEASAQRTTAKFALIRALDFTEAWAKHALGPLDAAVSCAAAPPSDTTTLPVSLH